MKINKTYYPPDRRYHIPPFSGYSYRTATPLIGGYLVGSLTGIVLMDYLAKLALLNRYYHEQIGVYKRW